MEIDLNQFRGAFFQEASELADEIEAGLIRLKSEPEQEIVHRVFRAAHSIKGNAGMFGLDSIMRFTHAMEAALDRMRNGALAPEPAPVGMLLSATDCLRELLSAAAAGRNEPASIAATEEALRALCDAVGETGTGPSPASPRAPGATGAEARAARGPERPRNAATLRVAVDKIDKLVRLAGEIAVAHAVMAQACGDGASPANREQALSTLAAQVRDLQESVLALRMVPVSNVFGRLPRLIADLEAATGKKADLEIAGGETELDRTVAEKIADPLTHLIRNAVDHGLEPPAEREQRGKPQRGRIRVEARHQGNSIRLEISDDGKGLDTARIRARALDRGLIRAQQALGDEEVHELIFAPGFSTAETVTDVSGRGVGMDVVKKNIEALGGSVSLASHAGKGMAVRIRLPLTIAIVEGLLVRTGESRFLIPLSAVRESIRVRAGDVEATPGPFRYLRIRGELVSVRPLRELMAMAGREGSEEIAVVLEDDGRAMAVLVDEISGQQQVVVQTIETNYRKLAGLLGAAILADGRIALIADPAGLFELAQRRAQTQGGEICRCS